jgi:hypothetical protein
MDLPSSLQVAAWKKMSAAEKYQLLAATVCKARELKRAGLRLRFPLDTPEQIETKLARVWLHARP